MLPFYPGRLYAELIPCKPIQLISGRQSSLLASTSLVLVIFGIEGSASESARNRVDLAALDGCEFRSRYTCQKGGTMLTTILIIILILILLGAFPAWPHSRGWGYGPSGVVGLVLVIVLILLLLGKL